MTSELTRDDWLEEERHHDLATGVIEESGQELLDDVRAAITRFVVMPSAATTDAVTLWIAATHAQPAWEHATRLVVSSPIKRCGKTRLQEIIRELVHRPISTTNISVPALVRSIDSEDPPTLILDEADTVFGGKRGAAESAEDLRGILNSGHSRGWPYIRWDMKARATEECPTFAMALIGGIGSMPDTIEDRAVKVPMRRRGPGESVTSFRRRRAEPLLRSLRDRLHAWLEPHIAGLSETEPELPVDDREADVWESLVCIADLAGGDWPARARDACRELCASNAPDEATSGERLLGDLLAVWPEGEDYAATSVLLELLHGVDEAPWADWYGRPFDSRGLAKLLRPYGVRSRSVRIGPDTPKGYARADLADPWARYTLPSATDATTPQSAETGPLTCENACGGLVADTDSGSATASDLHECTDVADVADVADNEANGATSLVPRACSRCGEHSTRLIEAHWEPGSSFCPGCCAALDADGAIPSAGQF